MVYLQFLTTNNEAEYKDLLTGLDLAKATEASLVIIRSDFEVIIEHVNKDSEAKGEQMKKYLSLVMKRIGLGFVMELVQIPKEENKQADCLAKATSAKHMTISSQVLSFTQHSPAIKEIDRQVIPTGFNWTTPIISYLKKRNTFEDNNTSRRLKEQASCFVLI